MVWPLLLLDRGGILAVTTLHQQEGLLNNITTIGLDLVKRVLQVHGLDQNGQPVLRKQVRRGQVVKFFATVSPCVGGMEACGSAHHGARALQAQGHDVRLIPPQYVRPFLKTNKHDAAEAIAEALVQPTMRFTPIKSADQQGVLMLHRSRKLLVKLRTMFINAIRGHCSELRMIASQGASRVNDLIAIIDNPEDARLPAMAREALGVLLAQLEAVKEAIRTLERKLQAWHRSQQASQRVTTIPGVDVITATALIATIDDGSQFNSGRHLSAWLGLVPRQHSSGGKSRQGRISKRGDGYLRRLLVQGSRAVLPWQRGVPKKPSPWIGELLTRRPTNVVLVAMANKTARIVWAMMGDQQTFTAAVR
jgi:transposase